MSNLVIWAHNSTIDYNYRVRNELDPIVRWILEEGKLFCTSGQEEGEKVQKGLSSNRGVGVKEDMKFSVTNIPDALEHIQKLRDYLEKHGVEGRKLYPDIE